MRNKISLSIFMLLVISLSSLSAVLCEDDTFSPLIGITDPEKYYSCYIQPDGLVRYDTIMIPIISTMWETQTIGAILFDDVTLNQYELINNATLRLYFDKDLEPTSENLWITVYGADAVFSESATLNGITSSFPITDSFTNINLQNITSAQWVSVDVTDIVQEIVNKYGWFNGAGLGILIYGTPKDTARSYQSNIGTKYPQLIVTYGENPSGGGEADQYRGYTIIQSTGDFNISWYNKWIPEPISYGGSVSARDSTSWDSAFITNGDYGEVWGNWTDSNGNFYDYFYQSTLSSNTLSAYALAPIGSFNGISMGTNEYNQKAVIWALEDVYGAGVGGDNVQGYICCIAKSNTGHWITYNSNSWGIIGLGVRDYNSTHVRISVNANLGVSASSTDITVSPYFKDGEVYLIEYMLKGFDNFWLGSKYQYDYYAYFYHLNAVEGEIEYLGRYGYLFNTTNTYYIDQLETHRLYTARGSSATSSYVQSYMSRGFHTNITGGWIVIPPENGTAPNPDCIAAAETLEDVYKCIDTALGGTTDDNPDAYTENTGYFTRPKMRLYVFVVGWLLVWLPLFMIQFYHGVNRVYFVWILLFSMAVGFSLLWAIPTI